jgi:hypothetical protein
MTTISYLNVSSAAALSDDIKAIDLASQADGGNGTQYLITLQAGATLTESADISAINLTGKDTLTLNGQGAFLNGAGTCRGFFAYSGITTIKNLTIENAVAQGGFGGSGNLVAFGKVASGGGGRGSAAACLSLTIRPAGLRRRTSRSMTFLSLATRQLADRAGTADGPPPGAGADSVAWAATESPPVRAGAAALAVPTPTIRAVTAAVAAAELEAPDSSLAPRAVAGAEVAGPGE